MKSLKPLGFLLIAAIGCVSLSAQPAAPAPAAPAVIAPADKPTAASIEKLLHLMKADQMMAAVQKNMRSVMDGLYSNPEAVGDLTPEKKAAIAKIEDKMLANLDAVLAWDNVKEITINSYQSAFSQKEIDAMVTFYETPDGQSIITKLPRVMQSSAMQMQAKLQPVIQKMMAEAKESADQLKAGNLAVDPAKPAPASPSGT